VSWNPSHEDGNGIPLDRIKMDRGDWEFSATLRDCIVAKNWGGMAPSEFWKLSHSDRALMIATMSVTSDMEAYEDKMSSKKSGSNLLLEK
jgi:hypothetical protein